MTCHHIEHMRIAKTLTLEELLLSEVEKTKGRGSTSERVNQLLKRALGQERRDALEREAAHFFSVANHSDRQEEHDFERAAEISLERD